MNKRKDIKKAMCQYDEKRNIKGSDKELEGQRGQEECRAFTGPH